MKSFAPCLIVVLTTGLSLAQTPATQPSDANTCCAVSGRAGIMLAAADAAGAPAAVGAASTQPGHKAKLDTTHWPAKPWPSDMVWIPGGEFAMGTNEKNAWNGEKPAHQVRVDGFWMDTTEVTNAQYRKFVEATGYKTVAERPVDWEELKKQVPPGTPKPPEEMLKPGALVFFQRDHPVATNDVSQWWRWTTGADWLHPEGPGSSTADRANHPVVQIAWEDAVAYAKWAGKRLPTEAEWECAARGGLAQKRFAWGDEDITDEKPRCNIWQGQFPWKNTLADKYLCTSPAGTFEPNGYGLHDMMGNVWEWCSDQYRADAYARQLAASKGAVLINPTGPNNSWDPDETIPTTTKRVIRGGSFLCHKSYCESYRPSARRGQSTDTGMSHVGFRCVMTQAAWEKVRASP